MHDVIGSSRAHWASGIGWVIYSLNEIDYLLMYAYGIITQQQLPLTLPTKWVKVTTAERIKMVEGVLEMTPESPATLRIKRILSRARDLMDKRNHIAHGTLALADGNQFKMLRYDKSTKQTVSMTYSELLDIEKTAKKLSDDFSLLISFCRMHNDILKPYRPGEPQGTEEFKPYDPAPAM